MVNKLLAELQSRAHLSHFQLDLVNQYMEWAVAIGYDMGIKHGRGDNKAVKVQQIKDGLIVRTYDSMADAARAMKVDKRKISHAVSGSKYRPTEINGYKFRIVKQSA